MEYILGKCPHCNNVMSMPNDSELVSCPTCHETVQLSEAAALAGNPQPAQAVPANQGADNGAAWQNAANAQQPGMANPMQQGAFTGNAPVLGNWETSAGYTILGILACCAVNLLTSASMLSTESLGMASMGLIFSLIYLVFVIVYAVKIYPSFFTDKPMVTGSNAISFLNTFAGGIIFGLLWNHNLTRKDKGVSHIVYVVLIGLSALFSFIGAIIG
jgi:hypothetical protein